MSVYKYVWKGDLDEKMARLINTLWIKMLKTVKYRKNETVGLDYTAYHFYCQYDEIRRFRYSGRAESPHPESLPGKFVEISKEIALLTKNKANNRAAALKRIASKINELLKLIKI